MTTVLVTGALGTVGRWTVDRLAEEYDVVAVDLERPDDPRRDVDYRGADLTDQGAAWELLTSADADAVVHLAGIPRLRQRTDSETFATNVTLAYSVMVAAGEQGVPVVWTSSATAYGLVYAHEPRLPQYVPIDTEHPTEPRDAYSTSKVAAEEVSKMTARRYGVPVTTLRPSWVQEPGAYDTADVRADFVHDDPHPDGGFWSYVDVRDLASMLEAAVEASIDGRASGWAVYNASADETYIEHPTADAIECAFGDLPARCDIDGTDDVYATADAERDLGWTAEHCWRTAETASVPGPEL